MIIFNLILLVNGFVTGMAIVWTIGVIVLVVGLELWLRGSMGHVIGGRRHYSSFKIRYLPRSENGNVMWFFPRRLL